LPLDEIAAGIERNVRGFLAESALDKTHAAPASNGWTASLPREAEWSTAAKNGNKDGALAIDTL
jgi:hypothetical protein